MLSIRQALAPTPPTGGICGNVPAAVGISLIGSALHRVNATTRQRSRNREASQRSRRMSAILRFRPRATGFASLRSPFGLPPAGYVRFAPISQIRTQSSTTQPPHLPPGLKRTASLCRASSPSPTGLLWGSCSLARGFDSLRSPWGLPCGSLSALRSDSHSLPSDVRSPSRPWPLLVLLLFIVSHTGDLNPTRTSPMMGTHKTAMDKPDPASS